MALSREEFGRRLRSARERANMTQQDLADAVDLDWRQIQRYDTGRAVPRPGRINTLAQALGIDPSYLQEPVDEHAVDRTARMVEENAVALRTALGLLDGLSRRIDSNHDDTRALIRDCFAQMGQRLDELEARQDAADARLSEVQADFLRALGAAAPAPAADAPGQAKSTRSNSSPGERPGDAR